MNKQVEVEEDVERRRVKDAEGAEKLNCLWICKVARAEEFLR